jgi:tight adherence protein C
MNFYSYDMTTWLPIGIFIVIFLFLLSVIQYFRNRGKKRRAIEKIRNDENIIVLDNESEERRKGNIFAEFFRSLGQRAKKEKPEESSETRLRFQRAGIHNRNAPAVYWGVKIFLAALLPLLFLVARVTLFGAMPNTMTIFLVACLAMMGLFLPTVWLDRKSRKRKESIARGLPDALDLMVVCVEAGMGLDAAINRVGQEMEVSNPITSQEFRILSMELRAGHTRRTALRRLADRVNLDEVRNFVTLLVQTDKFGTSIAQALRVYSDTFRTKRYQLAEEAAQKLPVKLIFPLLFFIFPVLFIVMLGPPFIQVYRMFVQGG